MPVGVGRRPFSRGIRPSPVFLTQAAGEWTPWSLGASLLGWWDIEQSGSLTLISNAVSQWNDMVANYALTAGTAGARPAYSAASFNGRPGATFDGIDDSMVLTSQPFPSGSSPSEIWALIDQTALVADITERFAFGYGAGANTSRDLSRIVSVAANRAQGATGNGSARLNATNGADFSGKHVLRMEISATATTVSVDGTVGTPVAAVPATGATRIRMGSRTSDNTLFWQGVMNSVLVTAPLSAPDAAQMTTYLKFRGGIA